MDKCLEYVWMNRRWNSSTTKYAAPLTSAVTALMRVRHFAHDVVSRLSIIIFNGFLCEHEFGNINPCVIVGQLRIAIYLL